MDPVEVVEVEEEDAVDAAIAVDANQEEVEEKAVEDAHAEEVAEATNAPEKLYVKL